VSRSDLHAVNGSQSADVSSTVAAPYPARHARDPGHRIEAGKAATIAPAGQARLANERDSSVPGASALTGAELRLLPLLSTHLSFPEIAGEFCLSRNTIRSQAMSIYQKLGASSRSQAVARSRELGLLEG
jgi:LuxR family transcriptional regulator, maltose regulon positive regulatory protein